MVDLSQTIIAKSDQLNADDLMGGPITVRVTRVAGMNDKEQPIAVYYEGDGGKPYKPGKSMRRVLVNFWGKNGDNYVGKWMTLYRDPEVAFGGIKVGGIRISAMSDIDGDSEMALAVTRGAKRRFEVKVLRPPQGGGGGNGNGRQRQTPEQQVAAYETALKAVESLSDLAEYQADERRVAWRDKIKDGDAALFERIVAAEQARFRELSPTEEAEDGEAAETGGDDGGDDEFPS